VAGTNHQGYAPRKRKGYDLKAPTYVESEDHHICAEPKIRQEKKKDIKKAETELKTKRKKTSKLLRRGGAEILKMVAEKKNQ